MHYLLNYANIKKITAIFILQFFLYNFINLYAIAPGTILSNKKVSFINDILDYCIANRDIEKELRKKHKEVNQLKKEDNTETFKDFKIYAAKFSKAIHTKPIYEFKEYFEKASYDPVSRQTSMYILYKIAHHLKPDETISFSDIKPYMKSYLELLQDLQKPSFEDKLTLPFTPLFSFMHKYIKISESKKNFYKTTFRLLFCLTRKIDKNSITFDDFHNNVKILLSMVNDTNLDEEFRKDAVHILAILTYRLKKETSLTFEEIKPYLDLLALFKQNISIDSFYLNILKLLKLMTPRIKKRLPYKNITKYTPRLVLLIKNENNNYAYNILKFLKNKAGKSWELHKEQTLIIDKVINEFEHLDKQA